MTIEIRYAQDDHDVTAIHRFLVHVAIPHLRAPVDALDSVTEVNRVCYQECGLMAVIDNTLVGTLGLMKVPWWFNTKEHFMIDRWFFVLPQMKNRGVAARLQAEASVIAGLSDLDLYIMGKMHKRQNNITYVTPRVILSPSNGGPDVFRRLSDQYNSDHADA